MYLRGKKAFFINLIVKALGLGVAIAAIALFVNNYAIDDDNGYYQLEITYLLPTIVATAYYGLLFLLAVFRICMKYYCKYFTNFNKPYIYNVYNFGKLFALGFTATEITAAIMLCFRNDISSVQILGAIVLPIITIADYILLIPHDGLNMRNAVIGFIFPIIATCGILASCPLADLYISCIAMFFIGGIVGLVLVYLGKYIDSHYGIKRIPYPLLWDSMPIDISQSFGDEKPAGKHGFVTVKGEDFVFEDGTPVKFWGVNFNSAQNFPSHEHAEKVATRLSAAGVNLVRFHQLDAEWAVPNIFRFKEGTLLKDTRHFDPDSMDRLDYLVYCLKNQGIYIYLDFVTYRRFRSGDGVENADNLPEGGKPYGAFNRTLIELQKEYNRNLLNHVNKYTGLAYKDEPAIAMSEVINECDLMDGENHKIALEPYRTELENKFKAFAKDKGITVDKVDFIGKKDKLLREFLFETQKSYVEEIISDIRSTGARFPMTAMNRESDRSAIYTNSFTDFSDSHAYWRSGTQKQFMNDPSCIQEDLCITRQLVTNTLEGKPFFVSEWDAPWPNEFRADATLITAAIGAYQGWSGFALHTYRYLTYENPSLTEKLGRSIALGGSYSRGLFDCYNDPAKMGLFYHAALILRRGDVSPAKERKVMSFTPEELISADDGFHLKKYYKSRMEEASGIRFKIGNHSEKPFDSVPKSVVSNTQELKRDVNSGKGIIDTPRTKVVYGMSGGHSNLNGLSADIANDFATLAISSLDGADMENSANMLLTAVGRADNDGVKYDFFHTSLTDEGKAPIMVEVIKAKIKLKTTVGKLQVFAVNNEGLLIGQVKSTYKDGALCFEIGSGFDSIYYLIRQY